MSETNRAADSCVTDTAPEISKLMCFDLRPDRFSQAEGTVTNTSSGVVVEIHHADSLRNDIHGVREFDDYRQTIPKEALSRARMLQIPLLVLADTFGEITPLGGEFFARILHHASETSRFQRLLRVNKVRRNADSNEYTRRYWPDTIFDGNGLLLGVCGGVRTLAAFSNDGPTTPDTFNDFYQQAHLQATEPTITIMFYRGSGNEKAFDNSRYQLTRIVEIRVESELPPMLC